MKYKKIISAVVATLIAVMCLSLSGCKGNQQQLNYEESVEKINNPDQGFYRPIYVRVTESDVTYNKNIVNNSTQLYHLRIDISAFSKAVNNVADKPLTQTALDGLTGLLSFLKGKDKNAVVRFAYDPSYGGQKNKEPDFQMVLKHVEQIGKIFEGYDNTVTAIEVGLVGPWGEMHSSSIANAEHFTPLIDAFLTHTSNIPVLVRTPKMIYDYLGIKLADIDNYTVSSDNKAYRLGLFNDGYLGSNSDLGTYTDREREIEFLSKQTDHLPFGGEVVVPDSPLHDIATCLPEMDKINLSYLNIEWNNNVVDKWKNSTYTKACGSDKIYYGKTAFEYIENHMGYRFVLTSSTFEYNNVSDKLNIELKIKNVGFGNLNKIKHAKLIFVDANGAVAFTKDAEDFTGNTIAKYSAKINAENGKYDVYLRLYGEELDGTPLYCLQFANDGLWNAELKANKIGSVEIGSGDF